MPLFGAHMSIAGGYHNALLIAQAHRCDTVQLFTKNNNQWYAKDITVEEIATFKKTLRATRLKCPIAHDCYLINLASPVEALYRQSLEAFVIEMQGRSTGTALSGRASGVGGGRGRGSGSGPRRSRAR